MTSAVGFCQKDQMPPGGPFVSEEGYSIKLEDGTVVTGAKIISDLHDWLKNGAHEN
jgi:hypothetical protein